MGRTSIKGMEEGKDQVKKKIQKEHSGNGRNNPEEYFGSKKKALLKRGGVQYGQNTTNRPRRVKTKRIVEFGS